MKSGFYRVSIWSASVAIILSAAAVWLYLARTTPPPPCVGPRYSDVPLVVHMPIMHFAVYPAHNPQKLAQAYQPLMDYLNRHLTGVQLELEASRNYADYEEKFRQREPEFLLPNPWQSLEAMKVGYTVIAMAGESADFKGLFIVRKDSGIREPSDLKGKAVSYPAATAVAACIMPQWYLHGHGIDVMRDIDNRYVGSQESSIMNAYLKQTAAGVTWPPPWRTFQKDYPEQAAALEVVWETPPLINNSVMVRNDVPDAIANTVREALLRLGGLSEGAAILSSMETARFLPAENRDYEIVRRFIDEFERKVRKVEDSR